MLTNGRDDKRKSKKPNLHYGPLLERKKNFEKNKS